MKDPYSVRKSTTGSSSVSTIGKNYFSKDLNDSGGIMMGKVSFEQLVYKLKQGHEIEFFYKDDEYLIANFKEGGRTLIFNSEALCGYTHDNDVFTTIAKIDGMTLKELFENHSDEIEFGAIHYFFRQ